MTRAALAIAAGVLVLTACTVVGDGGEPARPSDPVGGATEPPVAPPKAPAPRLPRIFPSFDPVATETALDRWPLLTPGVETRAVTSFDRSGGNDDGFGGTWSRLYVDERGESVLFDGRGPGVVRTIWFTSGVSGDAPLGLGLLRFYFDGEARPRIAIDADTLFSGTIPPFVAPLVTANQASSGGFVSWVPLAYRDRLRITSQTPAHFYAIHHEVLPPDWDVQTFSLSSLPALSARFAASASTQPLEDVPLDVTRAGEGTIDVLRFEPSGTPNDAAIRAARLEAWFDGEAAPQIDVPLATFFGSGLGQATVRSVAWTMDGGIWESRMPMPFWAGFRLRVSGLAGILRLRVAGKRFAKEEAGTLEARFREERPTTDAADFRELEVTGAGKVVATVLAIEPPTPTTEQWWEGDQRVHVDGRRTPSIHGSGHEDDFLGGWSDEFLSRPFSLPLHGLPRSEILDTTGQYNANVSLYRIWPGITFLGGARATREHGPSNGRQANYGVTTFLYRRPMARIERSDAFDTDDAAAAKAHAYVGSFARRAVASAFEGESGAILTSVTHVTTTPLAFELRVRPDNRGVKLRILHDAATGPFRATLLVEGYDVTTVQDLAGAAAGRSWREEDVFVPPQLTKGKERLAIALVPEGPIDASRFEAWSVLP